MSESVSTHADIAALKHKRRHRFDWAWPRSVSAILAALSFAALLGLTIYSAATKTLVESASMLGFLVFGWAIYRVFREPLPRLAALFAVTTMLNALGWVFEYYSDVPGFDEIAHGLTTTALTGLVGCLCFRSLFGAREVSSRHLWIALLSLGIAIGALWEIVEWFSYLVTGRPGIIKSLNDTVSDLIWDVVGAALALPLLWQDALRRRRGDRAERLGFFSWRWFLALAAAVAAVWGIAENRGDDALEVASKRQIVQAYRSGRDIKARGRIEDEDIYSAAKEHPDRYVGKKLVLRRTISAIVSPTVIKIDADGLVGDSEMAVVLPKGELPEQVRIGDQFEIVGSVKLVKPAEYAAYGLGKADAAEPLVVGESVLDHAGDE
jgi:hypothetical protein